MPSLEAASRRIWTSLRTVSSRAGSRRRHLMIGLGLAVFATLSGCSASRTTVLLDERIPHQVAEETEVVVWGKLPDGRLKETRARLPAGWWVASPLVTEGKD